MSKMYLLSHETLLLLLFFFLTTDHEDETLVNSPTLFFVFFFFCFFFWEGGTQFKVKPTEILKSWWVRLNSNTQVYFSKQGLRYH